MRLSSTEISAIKNGFKKFMQSSKLYLFGSRTDSKAKGGDIDILILSEKKIPLDTILDFEVELIRRIGERKIDILNYKYTDDSQFLKLIMKDAVEL